MPYRWVVGEPVQLLPMLTPNVLQVNGMSADGTVIAGRSGIGPAYWRDGQVFTLPLLPYVPTTDGIAYDASGDGSIVVGQSGIAAAYATLWHRDVPYQVFKLLNDRGAPVAGWGLETVTGISDDGLTIVGHGYSPGGVFQGWIAHFDRCNNGLDDDGDGLADYPSDPGCANRPDASETSELLPCDDGLDNDGDGAIDFPDDPACQTLTSALENPKCDDELDNDGDGKIDWDGGAAAGTPDPQCLGEAWRDIERSRTCGLGAELAVALALVGALRRRR